MQQEITSNKTCL